MFNKSFWAMQQDLKHGNGLAFSIFGGQNVTNKDKQAILDLNTQMKNGVKPAKAWANTMSNCSIAAQEQARQCLKTKGSLTELANGLDTTTLASKAATLGMKALSIAGNMITFMAISQGISFLVTAIMDYVNRIDNAIEASQRAKETIDNVNSSFKSQQDLINKNGNRYAELAQHVNQLNNTNLDLKEDEYNEFLDISNQIAEQFPSMIKGYDDNGNAILNLNGNVSTINSTLDEYIKKAEKASKIKIVQAFKGEGDNDDYFKGAKHEVDELKFKATLEKKNLDVLYKIKNNKISTDDEIALFGNYTRNSDPHIKAQKIREYSDKFDFDFKSPEVISKMNLSNEEQLKLAKAFISKSLDGSLNDKAILTIDEIFSKHSEETGYNFSDYITQEIKTSTDNYEQFADNVKNKNKEIAQNAQVVLESSVVWSDQDTTEQMKTTMTNALDKIDWSDEQFEGFDGEKAANYIQTTFTSYFEKLSPDDKITVDNFFESDPNNMDLSEYINLYEKIKTIFKKKGINIPISIGNSQNIQDTFNKSLEGMSVKDQETVKKYLNEHSINTASEIDVWNERTEGINNATEAIQAYEKKAEEVSKQSGTSETSPRTFSEAWDSLGTEGTDEEKKAAQESKQKLLELAEAGKLTVKAFQNKGGQTILDQTGLSAEEATQKVNELASSADQLSSMKTGISSISSILGEKKSGEEIGADTLAGMPEDVKAQTDEYEHFVEVLGDGTSKMEDCQDAANKLATAYVNSNNFLSNLTHENEGYYISVLEQMGVENAAAITKQTLINKEKALGLEKQFTKEKGIDLKDATFKEISAFATEKAYTDQARNALYQLALQKKLTNGTTLDFSSDISGIISLVKKLGGATSALEQYNSIKNGDYYVPGDAEKGIKNSAQQEIEEAFKKGEKGTEVDVDIKPIDPSGGKGSGSKGDKDKSKSTQQIDWISRALDRLSSKLDLVKAKYDNLFKNKKAKDSDSLLALENKNLDKQYKLLKRTENYQRKAQKKYTKKANNVKLSASLKKAVRDGRINGSMKKLIATYGEKKAKKIQKYQDYYDKAQEQKKNIESTKTAKKENRIQKYQNIVDNADEKRSLAQARKENAKTAEEKNIQIQEEQKHIETSYQYQIKIANLEKDSLKVAQLQAEKKKELLDLDIEQHQNLADKHQSTLDLVSAEKELASKVFDKNGYIDSEKAATEALYNEKIAIANLEGNISEAAQLQAEKAKQLRDLEVERHQNLADEYQLQLDLYSAQKDNLNTASEKNNIVDQEKEKTKQLYAEKMAIASLEGNTTEQLKLQQELDRQMVVLEKEKFDNITHYYENLRKLNENMYQDLSNAADELEARGLIVGSSLYSSQIQLNNEKKAGYEEQLRLLEGQLANIKQGTEEWYDALDKIQSCKNGIADCTKDTIALGEAIRNVNWSLQEKISSRFDLISSEYDLMIKLMSNKKLTDEDTGNFTEEGTATLGAYYAQLQLAQENTKSFKKNLDDMYGKLQRGEEGFTDQKAWDEYYEKHKEYIDLVGTEYDIQQNLIDLMKEKYQTELDYLQDIIDKRKELLQVEKDAYDYQRTIEEKTKNIGTLEKQISALSGDDSEAAKTRIQQLKVSLDDAKKDLQDTEYSQWISDQQTMLDNLYNEYSDFIDDKLNDTDGLLEEAIQYLNNGNIQNAISETITDTAEEYHYDPTNDFNNILIALGTGGNIVGAINSVATIITNYFDRQQRYQSKGNDVTTQIANIGDIYNDVNALSRAKEAQKAYDNLATAGDNGENIQSYVDSASVSTLNATGANVRHIYSYAEATKNAITAIENLDYEDYFKKENTDTILKTLDLYNSLSESGKKLVGDKSKSILYHQVDQWENFKYSNSSAVSAIKQSFKERIIPILKEETFTENSITVIPALMFT